MSRRSFRTTFRTGIVAVLLGCLMLGCGGGSTYRVSGKVTFKGQKIPAGKIYFVPDGSKGNTGPTGFADIKDGEYDTSDTGGRGAPPGPVVIAVEGIDPSGPPPKTNPSSEITTKALFPRYETTAELPKSASTKDIDVPADASKGPTTTTNPGKVIIP